jgi:hypothetical protein
MYVCEVCKKEFDCHKKLGGHTSSHRKTKKHLIYESNPKLCKECYQPISWSSMKTKKTIEFCCVSCRAKFFYKKSLKDEENLITQTKYL